MQMTDEEKKAYDNLVMLKYFIMEKEDKKSIDIILKLVEKQEKVIDEMGKQLNKQDFSSVEPVNPYDVNIRYYLKPLTPEEIKQYFYRKVERR